MEATPQPCKATSQCACMPVEVTWLHPFQGSLIGIQQRPLLVKHEHVDWAALMESADSHVSSTTAAGACVIIRCRCRCRCSCLCMG